MTQGKWDLDDKSKYTLVLSIELPFAETWADIRPGKRDVDKRERLRALAEIQLAKSQSGQFEQWAIRVTVRKKQSRRAFDIENVTKPIIDAFCEKQIAKDNSVHSFAGLYPDDSIDHLVMLQVSGDRGADDRTIVEVFGVNPQMD